jgi:hypothetical protein
VERVITRKLFYRLNIAIRHRSPGVVRDSSGIGASRAFQRGSKLGDRIVAKLDLSGGEFSDAMAFQAFLKNGGCPPGDPRGIPAGDSFNVAKVFQDGLYQQDAIIFGIPGQMPFVAAQHAGN